MSVWSKIMSAGVGTSSMDCGFISLVIYRVTVSPNGTLTITFLDMTESGVYMCFARNEAGETKKATWIKVNSMCLSSKEVIENIVCIVNLIGLSFHVIGMIHCYHTALIGSKLIQSYYWTHQLYYIHFIGSPPEIIDKPENLTITEGSNARLPCEATGAPKPTVAWTKSESL